MPYKFHRCEKDFIQGFKLIDRTSDNAKLCLQIAGEILKELWTPLSITVMTKGSNLMYTLNVEDLLEVKPLTTFENSERRPHEWINMITPLGTEPTAHRTAHAVAHGQVDRCEKAVKRRQSSPCIRELTPETQVEMSVWKCSAGSQASKSEVTAQGEIL